MLMYGGHHLTHGVERSFTDTYIRLLQFILRHTVLICIVDQRTLGRLTDCLFGIRIQLSIGTESHTDFQVLFIISGMFHNRHFILGQCTGLIGADDLGTSQSLYRCQLTDNRIAFGHVGYADGKHHGYYRCQTFRNCRYCKRYRNHKAVQHDLAGNSFAAGAENADCKDNGTDTVDQNCQDLTELIHLDLQRSFFLLRHCKGIRDLTHLRVHSGSGDHSAAAAVNNGGTHVHHVLSVAQRNILFAVQLQNIHHFIDRNGFTGQSRLFNLQAGTLNNTSVCRNCVTGLKNYNIARHQVFTL